MEKMTNIARKTTITIMAFLTSLYTFAQDDVTKGQLDININTNKTGGAFYEQIWFWIVVGLVFILLLVALLRNSNRN